MLVTSCGGPKEIPTITAFDEIAYPYDVKKVELSDGIEIAFMDEGKGEKTLLFIHGLGSYAPAWKKNIEELRGSTRCIALDLPGYGRSSKGKYEASMRFYAGVVQEFISKMALKNVTLVGHSMGGQIAITHALAFPEVAERLILVAPAGFETFNKGQRQWFREVLTPDAVRFTTTEQITENIAWNFYQMPDDAWFMVYDRIAMRRAKDFNAYCYIIPECVKGMVDQPVFDELGSIEQPVLVFFGAWDNLIPNRFLNGGTTESIAKKGAEKIKNCQLFLIERAGHFVQFEQSEIVNKQILNWLFKQPG